MKQKSSAFAVLRCLAIAFLLVCGFQPQIAKAEIVGVNDLPRSEVDGESTYWKDIIIDEEGKPVVLPQGVMPSTGDVKIAVIMVDFPDVPGKEAVTKELVEDLFFGEYSLSSYYEHASYGKLNISGDVYGWHTASQNREYYATEANIRILVNEVLEALEEEIDFTQYDNNNDDYIDGLYICYAGEKGEWASDFWSYVSSTAMRVDGKYLDRFAFINENHIYGYDELNEETYTSIYTIAHETGHMLGLEDYYDVANGGYAAIYSGATLMDDSRGELDAFSKYLLGWIDPVVITEDGLATLKPSFTNASAVIIYPDAAVRNENFLMVEYIPGEGSMGYGYTEGIRIYKINATSEDGYLCYVNSLKRDDIDLVDIFSDFNTEPGTILYADKAPSSYFIKNDSDGNAYLEYTGIAVDLVSFTDEEAEIRVSYREAEDVEITHTETIRLNNSKLYLEMELSIETLPTESANAYILIGNEKKNLQISRYDDGVIVMGLLNNDEKVKYVLYTADFELEGNTTYTVVVEGGSFKDPLGNTNDEFSFDVTTGAFPEVMMFEDEALYEAQNGMTMPELNSLYKGAYTPIANNQVIRFYTYLGKLYVEVFDANGDREVKLLYTPEENANLYNFNSVTMENGNTILRVRTGAGNSIFLVDKEWNCELIFTTQEPMVNEIGKVYNTAYLGVYDDKYQIYVEKLYLVSEDGEITEKELAIPYIYQVRAHEILGEEILLVSNDGFDFSIYDKNFNLIKEVVHRGTDYSESEEGLALIYAVERVQKVTVKDNKNVLITCTDGNNQWYELYLDANYNVIRREQLPFDESGVLVNLGDAYLFGETVKIGKEREKPIFLEFGASFMSFSPIVKAIITDTEGNEQYNFSIDFLADNVGDSIENVSLTEDGYLFIASAFGYVILEEVFTGYTVPEYVPEPTPSIDYISWTNLEDGTVEITELIDKSLTEVEIPSEIGGNPVTRIGKSAFADCTNLVSIICPDTVRIIDESAFENCTALTDIYTGGRWTYIGEKAFLNCSSLQNIEIPRHVTEIGNQAFSGCSALLSITIPDDVTVLGAEVFRNCSSLVSVELPEQLQAAIEAFAFFGCDKLENIEIPSSVGYIGEYAFWGCSSLKNIELPELYTILGSTFEKCSGLLSIDIPDSVVEIEQSAFYGCSSLTNVSFGNQVEIIGFGAFAACSSLTSIELPDSVHTIDTWAFGECRNLASVNLGSNLTTIGDTAFINCNQLTSIVIPKSVTEIKAGAFTSCNLETVYVYHDSYAEEWAQSNNYTVGYLNDDGSIEEPDPTADKIITFQNAEVSSITNATYSVDENGKFLAVCDGASGNYEICWQLNEPVDTSNYYKIVLECDSDYYNTGGFHWYNIGLYSEGKEIKSRSDICGEIIFAEDAMFLEIGLKNVADCVIDEIRLSGWSRLTTEYSVNIRNITFVNAANELVSDTGIYCEPDEDFRVLYCFDEFDLSAYAGKNIIIQFDMRSCGYDLSRPANIIYLGADNAKGTFDDEIVELEEVDVTDEWQTFQITCMVPSEWKDASVNLALAFWRSSVSGYDNGLCSVYYDNFKITEIVASDSVGTVDPSITDENITADTIADALNQNAEANNAVLAAVVPEVEVTAEDIETALGDVFAADEAVSVEIRPFLNVAVTELAGSSMTLDIKAQYGVYAVQGENEAQIGEAGTLDVTNQTMTITVPLPSGFATQNVIVSHKKLVGGVETVVETLAAVVDETAGTLTFTTEQGFSTFEVAGIEVKHNLSLESAIDLSFFIPMADLVDNTGLSATITHKRAEGDVTVPASWGTSGTTYWRLRYSGVAAKEMTDSLVLNILDAEGNVIITDTYSIKDYAMLCINDPLSDEELSLMTELLNYGAAAQIYFNYKTEDLANAEIGTAAVQYTAASAAAAYTSGAIAVKHNLSLESAIDLSFFIGQTDLTDTTGLTKTITHRRAGGDVTVTPGWETSGTTYWRLRYTGVAAKEMADELYLVVSDSSGIVVEDTYSIKDYAMLCINDPLSEAEYNLMTALLNYGASAQMYFNYKTGELANADLTAE